MFMATTGNIQQWRRKLKTPETLRLALNKYKTELDDIKNRLSWTQSWLDAANFMQEPELFVAQIKEREDLRAREKETDFKIRFVEWVLEEKKDTNNE